MSILAQQLIRPKLKPKWWGSLGMVESVVRYNCMKRGFPVPVLAMPFWEGAGNKVYDVSGKLNRGTLTNGAKWVAGRNGNAISFDGEDDFVNVPHSSSVNITDNLTISAWINLSAAGSYPMIVSKGTYSSSYTVSLDGGYREPRFYINGVGHSGGAAIPLNTWTHLAFTYGDGYKGIYQNGIRVLNLAASGAINTTTGSVNIGRSSGSYPFPGRIDVPLIFNAVLSYAQIKYLYDNPYFMYEMPEEQWGYAAAVGGATHPGWLWNKSGWF